MDNEQARHIVDGQKLRSLAAVPCGLVSGHDDSVIKRPVLRETISREKTVLAIHAKDAYLADTLLSAVRSHEPDAYLAIVVPEKRKNDAHDLEELEFIHALDRLAAHDGIHHNVQYILERLGRRWDWANRRWVQRRIKEARERFRDETLWLDGRSLGWPPKWRR